MKIDDKRKFSFPWLDFLLRIVPVQSDPCDEEE
jgi:hypothetical protein